MIKVIYKCDRCGKEREVDNREYLKGDFEKFKVGYTHFNGTHGGYQSNTIDVCEDCLAEFKKWMEGENDAEKVFEKVH